MEKTNIRIWDCPSFGCIAISVGNTERFSRAAINVSYKDAWEIVNKLQEILSEIGVRRPDPNEGVTWDSPGFQAPGRPGPND